MSEEGDNDSKSVMSDLGPRATQRGTLPPMRSPTPTPVSVPSERDRMRGTPVPISLERFMQKLLMATLPLGNPEKYMRDLIAEAVMARLQKMAGAATTYTKTQYLVMSNLLRILSEDD